MAANTRGQTPAASPSELILREVRDINRKIEESTRSGANVLIRVAQDNGQFFENYIGQITNGTYTEAGNLDWKLLSKWVVESMRRAAGHEIRADEEDITQFTVLGIGNAKLAVDRLGFIGLLIDWKEGTRALPRTPDGHSICIEFESEFLIRERNRPHPSVEGGNDEAEVPEGPPGSVPPGRLPSLPRGSVPPPAREVRRADEERNQRAVARAHRRVTEESSSPGELLRDQQRFGSGSDAVSTDSHEDAIYEGNDEAIDNVETVNKEKKGNSPSASELEEGYQDQQVLEALDRAGPRADIRRGGDVYWRTKVEVFFTNRDPATRKFALPGLSSPIEDYQAAAIVWLLTRIHDDKVAGCMLADDMGLGKTFTTFATIMAHHYCQSAFREVQRSWNQRSSRGPSPAARQWQHNARDAQPGVACPRQGKNPYGLQCPCVVGGVARQVVESMPDLPSIVVVPASGAEIWVGEWNKFVQKDERYPSKSMELYVGIDNYKDKPNLKDFCVDMTKAQEDDRSSQADEDVENGILIRPSLPFIGGSSNVLLLTKERTSHIMRRWTDGFYSQVEWTVPSAEPNYETAGLTPVAGCAIMIMDEWHTYKGSSGTGRENNGPFDLLSSFRFQNSPTLAVGCSGNGMTVGPAGWRRLVTHTLDSIKRHKFEDVQLGRLRALATYRDLITDWDVMQRNVEYSDGTSKEVVDESRGRVQTDFVRGITKMMIRRTKEDKFREQAIVDIAEPVMTTMPLKIPEGTPTHNVLVDYFQRIQHWVRLEHKDRMDQWREGGKQGPEPSLARAERMVLMENNPGGGNRRKKTGMRKHGHNAFTRCLRAVTYPDVIRIANSKDLTHLRPYLNNSARLHPLTSAFTDATLRPDRTPRSIVAMLRASPFHDHIAALQKGSPKFEALCDLGSKTTAGPLRYGNRGAPPADGSDVRHMVVFTESPLSAYLTALCLQARFMDNNETDENGRKQLSTLVEVILIHSSLPPRAAGAKTAWKSRRGAFEYFSQDCAPTDKNKILVGTYQLISTMHNFQRASSAVMLDVSTPVQRQQAKDRVFRRGQVCTAQITEMYYRNHVFEAQRHQRIEGNLKMEQIDWTAFGGVAEELEEGNDGHDPDYISEGELYG
ncbi:hypothetical protein PG999_014416 [Apiospora kogelbergensis]|uniref:SNF2 N-terminal domain-containing protein n=1 Tax=Apiospora kogelbergensis TaxID=1337665 RepID=A0AAW0Q4U3_9PEZI